MPVPPHLAPPCPAPRPARGPRASPRPILALHLASRLTSPRPCPRPVPRAVPVPHLAPSSSLTSPRPCPRTVPRAVSEPHLAPPLSSAQSRAHDPRASPRPAPVPRPEGLHAGPERSPRASPRPAPPLSAPRPARGSRASPRPAPVPWAVLAPHLTPPLSLAQKDYAPRSARGPHSSAPSRALSSPDMDVDTLTWLFSVSLALLVRPDCFWAAPTGELPDYNLRGVAEDHWDRVRVQTPDRGTEPGSLPRPLHRPRGFSPTWCKCLALLLRPERSEKEKKK